MRRLVFAVLLCLSVLGGVGYGSQSPAVDPPTEPAGPEAAKFDELLNDLDARAYARRESAGQEMFELLLAHPQLRPQLEQAAENDQRPEVRTRAARVLERVSEHALFGPSRITLSVHDAHPRQLIREFGRQANVTFEFWPEDPWAHGAHGRAVSLELKDASFWDALQAVSAATGLAPVEHPPGSAGSMVLGLHGQLMDKPPQSSQGAFIVQLRRMQINQHSSVELLEGRDGQIQANTSSQGNVMLELRLLVEPKIHLAGGLIQPIIEEAMDDRGNDLVRRGEQHMARNWATPASGWSIQSQVHLNPQELRGSRMISSLRGRFELEVAREVRTTRIPISELTDISRLRDGQEVQVRRTETAGPHRLELVKIMRPGDQMIQIEFIVRSDEVDAATPAEWPRLQAIGGVWLEDANGQRWMQAGESTQWEGGALKVTRHFHGGRPGVGPPHQIVWTAPLRVQTVPVEFAFSDIPLPSLD